MNKTRTILWILVLMQLLINAAPASKPAQGELRTQKIKPGTLSGIISDSTGQKLAGKEVLVVNAEGKTIGTATSNKYGMYRIKNLSEGEYILKVGDKIAAKLMVSRDATVSTLMVVMPTKATGLTTTQWVLIVIGGVAVVVGVPLALSGGGGSSGRRPVSP
jgi:hypothetical protein